MRQLVMAALLIASLPIVPCAFGISRACGAVVAVLVGVLGFFALEDSTGHFLAVANGWPVSTVIVIAGLVALVWALGPGSPPWTAVMTSERAQGVRNAFDAAGMSSPASRLRALWLAAGLLIVTSALLLQKRIDPYDTALATLDGIVARRLPRSEDATQRAVAVMLAEVQQRAEAFAPPALAAFRADLPARSRECLLRLGTMGLTSERFATARAEVERFTAAPTPDQARDFAAAAGDEAVEAARSILGSSEALVKSAADAAIAETRTRSTAEARQILRELSKDKLEAAVNMRAEAVLKAVAVAVDAAALTAVRAMIAERGASLDDAARRGTGRLAKATNDRIAASCTALVNRILAEFRVEQDRLERERTLAAAKAAREAEDKRKADAAAAAQARQEQLRLERQKQEAEAEARAKANRDGEQRKAEAAGARIAALRADLAALGFNLCADTDARGGSLRLDQRTVPTIQRCAAICNGIVGCDGFRTNPDGSNVRCEPLRGTSTAGRYETIMTGLRGPC